ncbi:MULTISPECIES: pyridoxamine 5'-phosphate oxidase family protein [unclassified Novosphingobium]|uniref:pyridoxamine 5'-phosphate oxidase family protein n=1 Tax=unclassified Novosphingobium TaxID=2644732 RepID=UPI000D30C1AF|nr:MULTISPECIES: pyridoxamine 5'-phosphate oxidase family protein [unclassified Novosphingobium]PTR08216.1 general stress protein 26 [Novosphingobium sp. GV055]PUB00970.1 general stress protein 26 [Novosphingobium sp. GV061]PUB16503.1 general stress protein 26 [Novosphingobium sp. GV079]PUB39807.1 general stress protein 26 [Novosphingobium sp. GV027]
MHYDQGNPAELKEKFWKELAHSPFVMLQLDADPESAAPMTAQLDRDANHAIWFFTLRDNRFAAQGGATATYAAKGHDLFARFTGALSEETDRGLLDKHWSRMVESWFPGGKNDPNLLFLRMDLGEAAIWSGEVGVMGAVKMALGLPVGDSIKGGYAETSL